MIKFSITGAPKVLKHDLLKAFKFHPSSVSNLYTASKFFQISQSVPELNGTERDVVDKLFSGLLASNRASLAQAITLIESTHVRKQLQARELLNKTLKHCKKNLIENGDNSASFRIGNLKNKTFKKGQANSFYFVTV